MKVLLTAHVATAFGPLACRVHDISRGGVCLDADAPVAVGTAVLFSRGTLRVTGTVAWSDGCRFGVRFRDPIRATDLLIQMSAHRHKVPS